MNRLQMELTECDLCKAEIRLSRPFASVQWGKRIQMIQNTQSD